MKRNLSLGIALRKDEEFFLVKAEAWWLFEFGLRRGSLVSLEGADGKWFRGRVVGDEPERVRVRVFEELAQSPESSLEFILLPAVLNKERMELIIEKAVELGADIIQPFFSERSYHLSDYPQPKWRRWQDRAVKASMQCRRGAVARVLEPNSLKDAVLVSREAELKLVLYEGERDQGLREVLEKAKRVSSCALASGPEGGFAPREIGWLKEQGFIPVSLGGRIVRAETSAIIGAGIVQFYLGDLGGGGGRVGRAGK